MLGTPNGGSEIADGLKNFSPYRAFFGPAGQQLGTQRDAATHALLPAIDYPVGIIAGNRSIDPLASVFLPRPHDGRVSVANTKLDGMADHVVVPAAHPFLPGNAVAIAQTLAFLRDGKFTSKPAGWAAMRPAPTSRRKRWIASPALRERKSRITPADFHRDRGRTACDVRRRGRWAASTSVTPCAHQFVGAGIDVGGGNLERQLKRGAAGRRRRIGSGQARPCQRQRVAAELIFEPVRRQLALQRQTEHVLIEAAHRRHVAHEDHGVVDGANGLEGRSSMAFGHDDSIVSATRPIALRSVNSRIARA